MALLRAKNLYDTIGITSTDVGLQVQAERAQTAALLSTDQTTSSTLTAQHQKTGLAVGKFLAQAQSDDARSQMGPELQTHVDALATSLGRLTTIRESVSFGKYTRLQAIAAYNEIMDELFAVYERLVSVPDLGIFQQANAMQAMGNGYDMISREDALIRGALTQGSLSQEEHNAFDEWVATRRFLFDKGRSILTGEMRGPYEEVLSSSLFDRFKTLEDQIVNQVRSGGPLPAEADRWKATVDGLVLRLDAARIKSSDALTAETTSVATGIMARIALAGGLGLIAVIATIIFSVRFGRRLVLDLAGLRYAALELADVRLPDVVDRLKRGEEVDVEAEAPPIRAGGSQEVEDVANAFSSVQRTAVEAAVGQAALRHGVNQVFLNLARRKQSLLHRQLTLLDAMQRRATEPESLEDLFRLDHLTTRMRRHAESLIILSGAAPGRSWRKPVPVLDVVRAAISEVEDYTRVTVLPLPNATLAGATVADLIHLLAELLENATIFSPPQTRVQVRGEVVANGLVLEIEDRGLGLAPEEYDAINERLASPPEFDLTDSDRLGLFVVGQLAARYGIGVVLRSSPYGGTTGIVLIPRSLVADDGLPSAIRGPAKHVKVVPQPAQPALPGPAEEEQQDEQLQEVAEVRERFGPDTSPFFTPTALRTEEVPSAVLADLDLDTDAEADDDGVTAGAVQADLADAATPVEPRTPAEAAGSLPTRSRTVAPLPTRTSASPPKPPAPVSNGTYAGLPRRIRQANIAPQLREPSQPLPAPVQEERSPEEARAMFSAFQRGARRGREDALPVETHVEGANGAGGNGHGDYAHNTHGEKGDE